MKPMHKIEKIIVSVVGGLALLIAGIIPLSSFLVYKNNSKTNTSDINEIIDEEPIEEEETQYNTINYYKTYGFYDQNEYFDADSTKIFNPLYRAHKYEGESGTLYGETRSVENSGCSNSHYVGYFESGSKIEYVINSYEELDVLFTVSLATSNEDMDGRECGDYFIVSNNDAIVDTSDCYISPTLSWEIFDEYQIGELSLGKGENIITISSFGGFNVDYFVLTPKKSDISIPSFDFDGSDLKIDIKDTRISGCRLSTDLTCSEYVNESTTFLFSVDALEKYSCYLKIRLLIQSYNGDEYISAKERFEISINGRDLYLKDISVRAYSGEWWLETPIEANLGLFALKEGRNVFTFSSISGDMNIYAFEIVKK